MPPERLPEYRNPSPEKSFEEELVALRPALKRYAQSLSHNEAYSEDLAQETIEKAIEKKDMFQEGTNVRAWTFTILRNLYLTKQRKLKREVEDGEGVYAARLSVAPDQDIAVESRQVKDAMKQLSPEHQEALRMAFVEEQSYDEIAKTLGVEIGTVKSRISRARENLKKILRSEDPASSTQ